MGRLRARKLQKFGDELLGDVRGGAIALKLELLRGWGGVGGRGGAAAAAGASRGDTGLRGRQPAATRGDTGLQHCSTVRSWDSRIVGKKS